MSLGWKILLPLTLVNLLVTGAILLMQRWRPCLASYARSGPF